MALLQSIQVGETLSDVVPKMASVPLSFQPGSAWEYSGAIGFDVLARIVEIVAGVEIDQFLHERLYEPLQMTDTSFNVPPERQSELATVYDRGPNELEVNEPTGVLGLSTLPGNCYCSGGGGLVGTAGDYARFALVLAHSGQLAPGERLLSRKTVELMASNHIGDLPLILGLMDNRGYRFGLGVRVLENPGEASSPASRGTFGWSGAFGTQVFIDPPEQMVGILLIQRKPGPPNDPLLRTLWPRYQNTCYQALDD